MNHNLLNNTIHREIRKYGYCALLQKLYATLPVPMLCVIMRSNGLHNRIYGMYIVTSRHCLNVTILPLERQFLKFTKLMRIGFVLGCLVLNISGRFSSRMYGSSLPLSHSIIYLICSINSSRPVVNIISLEILFLINFEKLYF